MIIVVYGLTCKLYTHIVVRNPRPQSDSNWDNRRGWLWCEDHMCSPSVNTLLRYFIERSTLITSRFPWGPTANRLVGQKMSCKFLIASTHNYIRNTCLWSLVLGCFIIIYLQLPMSWLLHELCYPCNARSSIAMPTVFNPTVYYCYYYHLYFNTIATIFLLSPLQNCCYW
jgi:hypothetical protein